MHPQGRLQDIPSGVTAQQLIKQPWYAQLHTKSCNVCDTNCASTLNKDVCSVALAVGIQ